MFLKRHRQPIIKIIKSFNMNTIRLQSTITIIVLILIVIAVFLLEQKAIYIPLGIIGLFIGMRQLYVNFKHYKIIK